MELDETAKQAVRELGEAINSAVEKSSRVAEAIETLRELGYEPELALKLEIGLRELNDDAAEEFSDRIDFPEDIELDLTEHEGCINRGSSEDHLILQEPHLILFQCLGGIARDPQFFLNVGIFRQVVDLFGGHSAIHVRPQRSMLVKRVLKRPF